MKRLSAGCVIIGIISIILAALNAITVFLPVYFFRYLIKDILPLSGLGEFIELILPFRGLELLAMGISETLLKSNIINAISAFIGYICSIILAFSGIGTILVKPWGRKLGYIYSIMLLVIAIISIPIFLIHFFRFPFSSILGATKLDAQLMAVKIYSIVLFLYVLYPLILVIFFTRPRIKEKFAGIN